MMNSPLRFLLLIPLFFLGFIFLLMFFYSLTLFPGHIVLVALGIMAVVAAWWYFVRRRGLGRRDLAEGEFYEPWSTRERV